MPNSHPSAHAAGWFKYRPSYSNIARQEAIEQVYQELSEDTRERLDYAADTLLDRLTEIMQAQQNSEALLANPLTHKEAVALILQLFFMSDWYPINNMGWELLQDIPEGRGKQIDLGILDY